MAEAASARSARYLRDAKLWREAAAAGGYHVQVGDWRRDEGRAECISYARSCLYMARRLRGL